MNKVTQEDLDKLTDRITKVMSDVEDIEVEDSANAEARDQAFSSLDDAKSYLEDIELADEGDGVEEEQEEDGDVEGSGESDENV